MSNHRTGSAHPSAAELAKVASKRVRLDMAKGKLTKHLRIVSHAYGQLGKFHERAKGFGLDARLVYYEDLAANATGEFAALAKFVLGDARCPSHGASPGARAVYRIHTKGLADVVSNWDEVAKKLRGTRYGKFVEV